MSEAYTYEDEPMSEGDAPEMEDGEQEAPELEGVELLIAQIGVPNLAEPPEGKGLEDFDETDLARIGSRVVEEYELDEQSLIDAGWKERHDNALKLAMQVKEVKNYPWPKAASIKYPLIIVAAMQFAARAYPAIVDGSNVVKGKVLGKPSEEKRARADRIGRHMSYQILEEMPEWEEGTDQLLHILPVTGTVFRKTYFDPSKGRNRSELVTADKLVVNYMAKVDAPRMTQVCEFYPHEIESKFKAGIWKRQELGEALDAANDEQAPHTFLEQHTLLDLDEDGVMEPYIVTVHKETGKVVRLVARYDRDGIKLNASQEVYCVEPKAYFTRYWFIPPLDGSYYGMGFGTLLDALNETINSLTNQLLDAGHLSNVQGGFIGEGVSLKSGSLRFQPGEWKRIPTKGGNIRDAFVPLPVNAPSPVLFQLLGSLIEASKDITATKDILTGDTQSANAPVGTTLAAIEQGLKVYSSIYKRVHRALKHELGLLYKLNAEYLDPEVYVTFQDDELAVSQKDYAEGDVDVIPVSDPSVSTDMQRIGRAQYLLQFMGAPGMNPQAIIKRALEAVGIQDVKELFAPPPQGPNPDQMLAMKELELKEREVIVKEEESKGKIAVSAANAQKAATEALLANPQFAEMIAGFLDIRIKQIEQQGKPNGPVQQGNPGGMAQPAPDAGLPEVPQRPAGGDGPPMGAGPGDVAPGADQSTANGGVGGPPVQ